MTYQDPGDQKLPGDSTDPAQLGMFEPRARTTDPQTSHEAAASMADAAGRQRAMVLLVLRDHGPQTADAVDAILEGEGWKRTTAGRRLPELMEIGQVERTDEKRLTRSKRRAHVWTLAPNSPV